MSFSLFSIPAFSNSAYWSHIFQSCIFLSRIFNIPRLWCEPHLLVGTTSLQLLHTLSSCTSSSTSFGHSAAFTVAMMLFVLFIILTANSSATVGSASPAAITSILLGHRRFCWISSALLHLLHHTLV